MALLVERRPAKQRVTGSIPSQGTCLGYGRSPAGVHLRGNQSMFRSLFSPSLPLFKYIFIHVKNKLIKYLL